MTLAAGTFCILKFNALLGGLRPLGTPLGIATGVGAVALSTDVAFINPNGSVEQVFSVMDDALDAVTVTAVPAFEAGARVRHERGHWGFVVAQFTLGATDMVSVILQNQGVGDGALNPMYTDTADRWTTVP